MCFSTVGYSLEGTHEKFSATTVDLLQWLAPHGVVYVGMKRRSLMVQRSREQHAAWDTGKIFGSVMDMLALVTCVIVDKTLRPTRMRSRGFQPKCRPPARGMKNTLLYSRW